MIGQGMMDSN